MTYFCCFRLVGELEFHICADKTWDREYFRGDITRLQTSLFNKFFQAQRTSHKNYETPLWNTIYYGFLSKSLKISPLRAPSPPLYQCCGLVICSQHGFDVIFKPSILIEGGRRKHLQKVVVSIYSVTGCRNLKLDM